MSKNILIIGGSSDTGKILIKKDYEQHSLFENGM